MDLTRRSLQQAVIALLLSAFPTGLASAARDTDIPGFLHGEVGVGFDGAALRGRMTEDGIDVSSGLQNQLSEGETGARVDLRFGVLPGLEVFGTIPYVMKGYRRYQNVASMCGDAQNLPAGTVVYEADGTPCTLNSTIYLDPSEAAYTYNPVATNVPSYSFQGLDDVVLGVRFAPIHEAELGTMATGRARSRRTFPPLMTWRLELGLVLGTGGNFYEGGPGTGSPGLRLGTSFSKRMGVSDPYMTVTHTRFSSYDTTAMVAGQSTAVSLEAPARTELMFGVELIPYEDAATGAKFAVDFAGGGDILSEQTVVSGTLLPSVVTTTADIDGTNGEVVTEEPRVAFLGRLRLHYQIFQYLRLQANGSIAYVMPHRLESPYPIVLGRTVATRVGIELASTF